MKNNQKYKISYMFIYITEYFFHFIINIIILFFIINVFNLYIYI